MGDPLFILTVISVAAVVLVLAFGIGSFGKGGDFNQKYSNKMMRLRLLAQFIAVLLIVAYVYLNA